MDLDGPMGRDGLGEDEMEELLDINIELLDEEEEGVELFILRDGGIERLDRDCWDGRDEVIEGNRGEAICGCCCCC